MSQRSAIIGRAVTASVVALLILFDLAPASAAQPVFLEENTTAERAPLIADGTASVVAFGSLSGPEATASIRADFAVGDLIEAVLFLPDLSPENAFDVQRLPMLTIVTPSGDTTSYPAVSREPSVDAESRQALVRIATANQTAEAGETVFTISGPAATRFALRIGTTLEPVAVANYQEPTGDALQTWGDTPPPSGRDDPSSAQDPDLDMERLAGPRYDDSRPGRAAGLPLAIAAVAIMVVIVVIIVRARGARRAGSPEPGADRQFDEGSDGQ